MDLLSVVRRTIAPIVGGTDGARIRLLTVAMLLFALIALGGCGGSDATDFGSLVDSAASDETAAEATVTRLSGEFKAGELASTGVTDEEELLSAESAKLATAQADVTRAVHAGKLTGEQSQHASETTRSIEETNAEVSADQSIVEDDDAIAQKASSEQASLEDKFVERAQKEVCEKISQAQKLEGSSESPETEEGESGSESPEAESAESGSGSSEAEQERSAQSELAPYVSSETASTAWEDIKAIAEGEIRSINNVIELNPAGREAILEATAQVLEC
jgi:hypothetical protein